MKRDPIKRAFLTIQALQRRSGVTAKELADILDFDSTQRANRYVSAKYWIDHAGYFLPVVEIGKRRHEGAKVGRKATVYGVLR